MLGTPGAFPTGMEGRESFAVQSPRAGDPGAGEGSGGVGRNWSGNRSGKHGRLARSDEHSSGIGLSGSESGHALQVRRGREDSRLQAGQPLALQEVEAGPVDGREVEPDGAGDKT